mgnify:CR=1 FL=1
MEKSVQPSKLLSRAIESIGLFAIVVIIAGTYVAFGMITPKVASQKSANVLGVKSQSTVFYFPLDTTKNPLIDDSVMRIDPEQPQATTFEYTFRSFQPSQYEIPVLEIRNSNDSPAKVKISPSLSTENSQLELFIEIDGIELPLIDKNGTVLIPEVTLQPRTITPVVLHIRNQERINNPPTLSLVFVQFE